MVKLRRGNIIFITHVGDHRPRHVHVYKDYRELGKWDLEENRVMEGKLNKKIKKLIRDLMEKGKL